MNLQPDRLESLRRQASWALLASPHAVLILSFVDRVFLEPGIRELPASRIESALEEELQRARLRDGESCFPKAAKDYLADWTAKEWLRRFYVKGSDEFFFDLTHATEKAAQWVRGLEERASIGTDSRLRTFVYLLKQIDDGADPNPERRISALEAERLSLEERIERARRGEFDMLSDAAIRERFAQMTQLASDLLADFREVEHRFRMLSQETRERIASWQGSKSGLLDDLFRARNAIESSDQGRSFYAFYEFLLSLSQQEELSERLQRVLALSALGLPRGDHRVRKVHHEWLNASDGTQRMVARLSQQLRRFLEDQESNEGRHIVELTQAIERQAVALKGQYPAGMFAQIPGWSYTLEIPMERPLYQPIPRLALTDHTIEVGDETSTQADALYNQTNVDRQLLVEHINGQLEQNAFQDGVTLKDLIDERPLSMGLEEVITYLDLGHGRYHADVFETLLDTIAWDVESTRTHTVRREAEMARIRYMEPA